MFYIDGMNYDYDVYTHTDGLVQERRNSIANAPWDTLFVLS